ncbi:MAG TPA: hypothetical protein VGL56_15285 [Fimbriimonadaceae bacterium]|jgi:hypothetical protein
MAWQIEPPVDVHDELKKMGEIELMTLMSDVRTWIEDGDWDDIALARGISERGHSDDFSYWLLKEVRMRDIDAHKTA